MRAFRTWMIALLLVALGGVVTGCASAPVNKPCGVLTDNLATVEAKTRDGERRISRHFEAGVRAGCWGRS